MMTPAAPLNRMRALWAAGRCALGALGICFPLISTRADDEVLAIATIEHVDALGAIHEIAATSGLDLAFIRPGNLATSMGHRGRLDHPEVGTSAEGLEAGIRASPVALGGVAPTPEQANAMNRNRGDHRPSLSDRDVLATVYAAGQIVQQSTYGQGAPRPAPILPTPAVV